MRETLSLFAWTLAGTLAFALLGGLFGGLASWLSWRAGRATGSGVGRRVAEALGRLWPDEPTPTGKAVFTGIVDGALFLGSLGALTGVVVSRLGESPGPWLVPLFASAVALAAAATFFGLLALGMVRLRTGSTVGFFFGGMGGALITARYLGVAHIVPGAVAGIFLGTLLGALLPARR